MDYTKAPIISNPIMLDAIFSEIQTALVNNLDWLDAAFGRAQRLTKILPNGKRIVTPNVYCGGLDGHGENDYIETSPDAQIGNFSFFVVDDPQTWEWQPAAQMEQRAPFSLIFWFDLRRVFDNDINRNTEYLKARILELLNGRSGWILTGGKIKINKCYEQAENIYRGFSISEIDNQFLMHPYAGFRFEGEIIVDMPCDYIKPAVKLYNTQDADATPENLAFGKVAYNANGRFVGIGEITNLQEKTATPTTQQQVIEPDAQHNGLSKVVVEGVTHEIDENIIPGNIKQGINILGVNGTVVELQGEEKEYVITENGETPIIPGTGKNGITGGSIKVNIDTESIYNSGVTDGIAIQKAKLTGLNVSENGTFQREDGYNEINVNVQPELQEKTVDPATARQIVIPDSGKYGLEKVTVEPVTAAIDSNIVPGKIKNGVSVLGVNGSVIELNGQAKEIIITENGETIIEPDNDKNALTRVKITTNVVAETFETMLIRQWQIDPELYQDFELGVLYLRPLSGVIPAKHQICYSPKVHLLKNHNVTFVTGFDFQSYGADRDKVPVIALFNDNGELVNHYGIWSEPRTVTLSTDFWGRMPVAFDNMAEAYIKDNTTNTYLWRGSDYIDNL